MMGWLCIWPTTGASAGCRWTAGCFRGPPARSVGARLEAYQHVPRIERGPSRGGIVGNLNPAEGIRVRAGSSCRALAVICVPPCLSLNHGSGAQENSNANAPGHLRLNPPSDPLNAALGVRRAGGDHLHRDGREHAEAGTSPNRYTTFSLREVSVHLTTPPGEGKRWRPDTCPTVMHWISCRIGADASEELGAVVTTNDRRAETGSA